MNKLSFFLILGLLISCSSDTTKLKDEDDEIERSYTKMVNRISSNSFEDSS